MNKCFFITAVMAPAMCLVSCSDPQESAQGQMEDFLEGVPSVRLHQRKSAVHARSDCWRIVIRMVIRARHPIRIGGNGIILQNQLIGNLLHKS